MFEEQSPFASFKLFSYWLNLMPLIPECKGLEATVNTLSLFACFMPLVTVTQILVFKGVDISFKFSTFQLYTDDLQSW